MANFTAAEDRKLKRLWRAKDADGKDQYPASEIGRLMHRSKGSVVGRAHRLKLPARDTPIIRFSVPRPPPRVRRTLPPLASEQTTVGPPLAPVLAAPKPPKPPPAPAATPRPATGKEPPCCWPIGEPGMPGFRFCGCVALPGKPYCAEHAGLAYVPVSRSRRDVAEAIS